MFRPNHNPAINSIGEQYVPNEQGQWAWVHIARDCDVCLAVEACCGKDGSWYWTGCWLFVRNAVRNRPAA